MNGDEDQFYSFENILELWLKWLPLPSEIQATNQGKVQEWLNWLAWKAGIPQGIKGSNPFLSAKRD